MRVTLYLLLLCFATVAILMWDMLPMLCMVKPDHAGVESDEGLQVKSVCKCLQISKHLGQQKIAVIPRYLEEWQGPNR